MKAGAFPGAMRARYGKFEHARGGTDAARRDRVDAARPPGQAPARHPGAPHHAASAPTSPSALDAAASSPPARPTSTPIAARRRVSAPTSSTALNVVTLRMPHAGAAARADVPLLFLQLVSEAAARYRRDPMSKRRRRCSPRTSPGATGRAMCANCATPPTASCWVSGADAPRPTRTGARRPASLPTRVANFERSNDRCLRTNRHMAACSSRVYESARDLAQDAPRERCRNTGSVQNRDPLDGKNDGRSDV